MSAHPVLAVVGGGSVAVSFLYQFLHALPGPPGGLTVALFEPRPLLGPGDAYQADLPSNLLNIPAGRMSAIASDRNSFVDWLRTRDPGWLRDNEADDISHAAFLPRPVFGHYLQDIFEACRQRAQALGVALRIVPCAAVSVEQSAGGGAKVTGADGTQLAATRVVLCNGNLPSVAFPELLGQPGYFNSPYPVRQLAAAVGPDDAVCVIGTSLSAVDAIVALARAGHRGQIHCISRNGRLPSVRSPHNPGLALPTLPEADGSGRVTLESLLRSLRAALHAAGGTEDLDDVLGGRGPAGACLDEEIARSQNGPRLWQAVAAATNDRIEHIWLALGDGERQRFHRDWRSLWMARRATFPLRNALILQSLMHAGRLHVQGGYRSVSRDPSRNRYLVQTAEGGQIAGRWLVNATSFSTDVRTTRDPLIRQLVDTGRGQPDALGGLKLDFGTGCLIDAQGTAQAAISVLGSLAAGTYFWTTSMDVNARLAEGQARRIASELGARARRAAPVSRPDESPGLPTPPARPGAPAAPVP